MPVCFFNNKSEYIDSYPERGRPYLEQSETVATMMMHGGEMTNIGFAKGCTESFHAWVTLYKAIGTDEKIAPIERYHTANAGTNKFVCSTADTFVKTARTPVVVHDGIDG